MQNVGHLNEKSEDLNCKKYFHNTGLEWPSQFLTFQNKVDVILGEKEKEERISMKIDKDERSSVGPSIGGASRKLSEDINWNRKTLRLAFSENPYEKYKTKVSFCLRPKTLGITRLVLVGFFVCRSKIKKSIAADSLAV